MLQGRKQQQQQQNMKQKQYFSKFNKYFKNGPYQKLFKNFYCIFHLILN